MPYLIGAAIIAALGYTTKQVADAADTAGNASLKLVAAGAFGLGAYIVAKRVFK